MHILITMGLGIFGQDELFDVAKPVWRLRSLSQSLGEGDKKIGRESESAGHIVGSSMKHELKWTN